MQTESSLKIGKDKFGHTIYDEAKVLELRATGLGMRKIHNQTRIPKTTLHRIFKRNNIQTFPYQTKRWGNAFRIKERKRMVGQIFKRGSEARSITAKVIKAIRGGASLVESMQNFGACPEMTLRWLKKTKSYDALKWREQKRKTAFGLSAEQIELQKELRDKRVMEMKKAKAMEARQNTATLIKSLRAGIPIEVMANRLGINKSTAWNWIYKTKAYKILRNKINCNLKYPRKKNTGFISKKYTSEKKMMPDALQYVISANSGKRIVEEKETWETNQNGHGRSGLRADFFVADDNHIYECKQRCDPGTSQRMIGQIFIYIMAGYKVSAIMPNDIFIPNYLSEALKKMKVEMILI
jgi:hypothetical protein